MASNTVHSAGDIIAAIKGSAGIKTTIAKRLGVVRQSIDNYIERYPTVKEAYLTEKAGIDDAAQSVVINDILQNRSVETAKWWLRVKCADEFNPPALMDVNLKGEITQKMDADQFAILQAKAKKTAGILEQDATNAWNPTINPDED